MAGAIKVHLTTLGCARNEVDSEELAGRLAADGFALVPKSEEADILVVNTCGFIEAAKADSIETILAAAETKGFAGKTPAVVAVGCLAERYGEELARELPEVDAVLGFDSYAEISDRLRRVLAGETISSHHPVDRRRLLPVTPVARPAAVAGVQIPGFGRRQRLDSGPVAPLKIASGCDRRCAFCAIPSFRGSFVSRPIAEVVADAEWLVGAGVREVLLVSENSSSYGKDWGDSRALEQLLTELDSVAGLDRIRVSYLQPAEIRPSLIETMVGLDSVLNYFDLPFQHAAPTVLRRMRRHGGSESFLGLIDKIRGLSPTAGIRSNVIVGFPGETEADFEELLGFIANARLDALGVFGYSDEEGTEAEGLSGKISGAEIADRVAAAMDAADYAMTDRAEERRGERVSVLVESVQDGIAYGRAEHQGPEDGECWLTTALEIGAIVEGNVVDVHGVDLEVDR